MIQTKNVTADIETFARNQVEMLQAGEHGKTLYVTNDRLKEKIVRTLATKAEGMFLWVNLQLDSLCQASKAQKDTVVEAALEALPQGHTWANRF
ncbi:Ankyrin repeat protein [Pyrenophora tritici-repentis]|nr:Ankyrin repeat protein [Pyrenophora tritici-repentis]